MVRLLATPMVFVWVLILVAVEQIYDQITRRLVAQRVAPGARVILSQTPSFGDGGYGWKRWRTAAAGIAVAATMQLFVCTPETSHVEPTGPT